MKRINRRKEGEAGRVSRWHDDFDNPDLLRDDKGNKYEVSDEDYYRMLERRKPSSSKEIELSLAKELLNSNLNRLTEKQKAVIYYSLFGYSIEAMAQELSISVQAVMGHLERARKKLAKYITGTKEILQEGLQ